eukprot:scaffold622_cov102-Cylindrotheca_fusiformis.AAC.8
MYPSHSLIPRTNRMIGLESKAYCQKVSFAPPQIGRCGSVAARALDVFAMVKCGENYTDIVLQVLSSVVFCLIPRRFNVPHMLGFPHCCRSANYLLDMNPVWKAKDEDACMTIVFLRPPYCSKM